MSHRLKLSLLIVCAFAVYLVGNGRVPLWDRDEPRNAQAARQMLVSGDWVVPHFLDRVRTAKPPLTAWCQASAMAVLGQNSFAARLPSAVGMTLTLAVLAFAISKWLDPDRAFWTVLILSSSAIVVAWSARTSLTDAVLLLWITIAQLCLYAMYRGNFSWSVVITWAGAVGLAGLTKGPVVLGVQAMTLLILWLGRLARMFTQTDQGRAGRPSHLPIKTFVTIAIIAAIVVPWMVLVERRAPGFLIASTSRDVVQRVFEPLEQHKGPPAYYLLVVWGIYFPWSVLLPLTFVIAWRHFREDASVRFAAAAVIGPWLMMECVQTKLPHYLLPVFPPLAFLTADAIVRCLRGEHPELKAVFPRKSLRTGALATGIGMLLVMAVMFGAVLPNLEPLQLSPKIAEILRAGGGDAAHTQPGDVQMIAYKEPSLAFYQGGTIREQPENDFLATHPPAQWPTWIVIREDVWQNMPPAVKEQVEVVGRARGLDLADKARTWTVFVLRKRPQSRYSDH